MKNSVKTVLLIISIFVLVILTFAITYSYFASDTHVNGNLNITATTAGSYTLVVESSDSLAFNIEPQYLYTNAIGNEPMVSENASLSLSLASPDFFSTTVCKYDILFTWISEDQYTHIPDIELPYTKDEVTYPYLFSIKADKSVVLDTSDFSYSDTNLTEIDLSKLEWSKEEGEENNTAVLLTGQIASRSTESTVVTWDLTSSMYNIPIDQNFQSGNIYEAKIYVDNVTCRIFEETPESIDLLNEV